MDPDTVSVNAKAQEQAPSPARSIARGALATICNEAEFLQRMCDGQAANIRKMSDEADELRKAVVQLREINANQYCTIVQLRQEIDTIEPFRKMKLATYGQLVREAEFGRKMAAAAGTNIA